MATHVPFAVKLQVGASLLLCLSTVSLGVMTWQAARSRAAYVQELRTYATWQDESLTRLRTLQTVAASLRESLESLAHPTRPQPTPLQTVAIQGYALGGSDALDPSCQRGLTFTASQPAMVMTTPYVQGTLAWETKASPPLEP